MQYLSSPTRKELDRAHAAGKWLDIGAPTLKNLLFIKPRRSMTWLSLALSSIPLAILYNSTIFTSFESNDYSVAVVSKDFFSGGSFDQNGTHYRAKDGPKEGPALRSLVTPAIRFDNSTFGMPSWAYKEYVADFISELQSSPDKLQHLSNKDCINTYSTRMLTGHRNLFAVTSGKRFSVEGLDNNVTSGSLLYTDQISTNEYINSYPPHYEPFDYLCSGLPGYINGTLKRCTPDNNSPDTWNLFGFDIEHCRSEVVAEHCRLFFNRTFSITIIICNVVKVGCMIYAAAYLRDEMLCTQG
ncbi:uncharacterized protein KY384_008766 [Bacidia gigantensis]|uniref:uncharacterized protein n=1 Tax=Bacidia gigantensis TaxID=2732470 RepID=UPI001D04B68F|nr:uncharacterized protein KY384_008766 [Bacidia gigantensis]KAG8526565.1 hypothetical protein KY384_008766 [Bacidia gigantensis]